MSWETPNTNTAIDPVRDPVLDRVIEKARLGPSGLGGWLVLPILGLVATVLIIVVRTFTDTIPNFRDGTFALFTTPGSELYHPAWTPLLTYEYVLDAVMLMASVILLVLLFQKKPFLPKLMVWFYACSFAAALIDALVIVLFGPDMLPDPGIRAEVGWTASGLLGDLARGALVYAIWIPYFLLSTRVKNTFVKPVILSPAVVPPETQWSWTTVDRPHDWQKGSLPSQNHIDPGQRRM